MLQIRELTTKEIQTVYHDRMKHDFPSNERKPLAMMLSLVKKGMYHGIGLWEEGRLLAYAFLASADAGDGCCWIISLSARICGGVVLAAASSVSSRSDTGRRLGLWWKPKASVQRNGSRSARYGKRGFVFTAATVWNRLVFIAFCSGWSMKSYFFHVMATGPLYLP